MQKLLFSLIIIISSSLFAVAAPGEIMPRSLALGSASITCGGIDAVFSNPGALFGNSALFVGSQTYGLSLSGTTFALAKDGGGLGGRILASPDPSAWGGTDLLLWAGKSVSFGEQLQAGVALSGFFSSAPNIGGRGAMLDLGFLWQGDRGKVGLLWRNLAGTETWQGPLWRSWHRPAQLPVLGLAWEGDIISAAVDFWPEGSDLRYGAGFSFSLLGLDLRLGYDGIVPSVGLSMAFGERTIEYSWRGGQGKMGYLGLKFAM